TAIDEVIAYWKTWEQNRETLPFDIDGIVVKLDALAQQEQLGSIAKSPRWAVAFKFASRQAETLIKGIHLQIGRLGTVTPVADLEPVFLGGTTVMHATLHNAEYVKKLDIRLTDHVIVEKGGDVIPKVSSVILEKRRKGAQAFKFPAACPECGAKLFRPEGEANYFCENSECPAQIKGRIQHFGSRGAMDIEGLGEANVEQLVLCGLLKNSADIFDLHKKKDILIDLERWGQKSVKNLLDAVEKSKKQKFPRVLFALGIRHVGANIAQRIVKKFRTIQQLESASIDELKELEGIGPQIAESIVRYFADKHNRAIVKRLTMAGVTMEEKERSMAGSDPLAGKVFVITGALTTMNRNEAKERIESSGGKVSSTVSAKTDYVVVGADAGSKLKKAQTLKIPLIDERDLIELLTK
ncbi:MAG: NAD-dependent DNA ligase LigA, partial [Bacteroidota bacterium]